MLEGSAHPDLLDIGGGGGGIGKPAGGTPVVEALDEESAYELGGGSACLGIFGGGEALALSRGWLD